MIIIPQQFEGKHTYIVGSLIQNGCQIFKIEDLDEVCKNWEVHDDTKEAVKVAYEENSQTEEDWETLVKSKAWVIRMLVAQQGKCLDILVNDPDWDVRRNVAAQGYGLDILLNDPDWPVRCAVAKQGYGLDILVNDPHSGVRHTVAKQGYGLDILVNDTDLVVRAIARKMTAKQSTTT